MSEVCVTGENAADYENAFSKGLVGKEDIISVNRMGVDPEIYGALSPRELYDFMLCKKVSPEQAFNGCTNWQKLL